ncbi:MAG: hypothetical protein V1792_26660 [Pseudomonadota bacterium]
MLFHLVMRDIPVVDYASVSAVISRYVLFLDGMVRRGKMRQSISWVLVAGFVIAGILFLRWIGTLHP